MSEPLAPQPLPDPVAELLALFAGPLESARFPGIDRAVLEELADEGWVREDTTARMRDLYEYRRRRFAARYSEQPESGEEGDDYEERSLAYQRFRRELLGAERVVLLRLRSEGRISDEVRRRVERDLDLEDARLEI